MFKWILDLLIDNSTKKLTTDTIKIVNDAAISSENFLFFVFFCWNTEPTSSKKNCILMYITKTLYHKIIMVKFRFQYLKKLCLNGSLNLNIQTKYYRIENAFCCELKKLRSLLKWSGPNLNFDNQIALPIRDHRKSFSLLKIHIHVSKQQNIDYHPH